MIRIKAMVQDLINRTKILKTTKCINRIKNVLYIDKHKFYALVELSNNKRIVIRNNDIIEYIEDKFDGSHITHEWIQLIISYLESLSIYLKKGDEYITTVCNAPPVKYNNLITDSYLILNEPYLNYVSNKLLGYGSKHLKYKLDKEYLAKAVTDELCHRIHVYNSTHLISLEHQFILDWFTGDLPKLKNVLKYYYGDLITYLDSFEFNCHRIGNDHVIVDFFSREDGREDAISKLYCKFVVHDIFYKPICKITDDYINSLNSNKKDSISNLNRRLNEEFARYNESVSVPEAFIKSFHGIK